MCTLGMCILYLHRKVVVVFLCVRSFSSLHNPMYVKLLLHKGYLMNEKFFSKGVLHGIMYIFLACLTRSFTVLFLFMYTIAYWICAHRRIPTNNTYQITYKFSCFHTYFVFQKKKLILKEREKEPYVHSTTAHHHHHFTILSGLYIVPCNLYATFIPIQSTHSIHSTTHTTTQLEIEETSFLNGEKNTRIPYHHHQQCTLTNIYSTTYLNALFPSRLLCIFSFSSYIYIYIFFIHQIHFHPFLC